MVWVMMTMTVLTIGEIIPAKNLHSFTEILLPTRKKKSIKLLILSMLFIQMRISEPKMQKLIEWVIYYVNNFVPIYAGSGHHKIIKLWAARRAIATQWSTNLSGSESTELVSPFPWSLLVTAHQPAFPPPLIIFSAQFSFFNNFISRVEYQVILCLFFLFVQNSVLTYVFASGHLYRNLYWWFLSSHTITIYC